MLRSRQSSRRPNLGWVSAQARNLHDGVLSCVRNVYLETWTFEWSRLLVNAPVEISHDKVFTSAYWRSPGFGNNKSRAIFCGCTTLEPWGRGKGTLLCMFYDLFLRLLVSAVFGHIMRHSSPTLRNIEPKCFSAGTSTMWQRSWERGCWRMW